MDVCKTATVAAEHPLAALDTFLAEQEQQTTVHCCSTDSRQSDAAVDNNTTPSENKWAQPSGDHMTADSQVPDAASSGGEDASQGSGEELALQDTQFACQRLPQIPENTESLPSTPEPAPSTPITPGLHESSPLTPVTTDESTSSDDATADTSQGSNNPDWNKCQASTRRLSSASASSSNATASPSDTLAGASSTTDSLSSDETAALDMSQNSFESAKYQSDDLESVSVSSIVRRTAPCTASEMIEDASSRRRVSFPMKDSDLVTGYMEPANPWESANSVTTSSELINLYKHSCLKHNTPPLDCVLLHLKTLEFEKCGARHDRLDLKDVPLAPEACEAMEEILKRVQYQAIDLTRCKLNDTAATAIFDMIEFYESAVEVDVSENPSISSAGLLSCVSMIRKSSELRAVTLRGNALSELHASNLGKAINVSNLHTLKLEHCGLTGRPAASLCNTLRNNKTLKELWIAHNDLYCFDAQKIAELLKANGHLQFLDVSNNNLKDAGVRSIAIALIEQSVNISFTLNRMQTQERLNATLDVRTGYLDTRENVESQGNACDENGKSENSVATSTSGNRSMLDALLQMQPGECKDPVQVAHVTINNNDSSNQVIAEQQDNSCAVIEDSISRDRSEEKSDICVERLEPIAEALSVSQNDAEIMVGSDGNGETIKESENTEFSANNNTLEHSTDENLSPGSTDKTPKIFDLNENKSNAEGEPLLINIMNETNSKEPAQQRSFNNTSPLVFERPSSVDDFERQKKDDLAAYTTRSQSCDSLNSDNSLDAMETHLSAEIKEKITKNDTLGRQQKLNQNNENLVDKNLKPPRGLQALILWNNNITRMSGECIADMIASTNSLEILNIGKNTLSNDFIHTISNSLKYNKTLTSLGLQSTHLNSVGIKKLADALQFGGNNTLERIDIRGNNVQVDGLIALCDALKSNKRVTQIDIDDEPKRYQDDGDGQFHYSKYLQTIRSLIDKNQSSYEMPKIRTSRKISLTCQSIHTPPVMNVTLRNDTLDVKKKSGARLRSPLPSPPTASPSSSPVPSPSRGSRFHVSRVSENGKLTPSPIVHLETKPPEPMRSSPSPTSRFRVTMVKLDDSRDVQVKKQSTYMCGGSTKQINAQKSNEIVQGKGGASDIRFIFPDIVKKSEPFVEKVNNEGVSQSKALSVEHGSAAAIEATKSDGGVTQVSEPISIPSKETATTNATETLFEYCTRPQTIALPCEQHADKIEPSKEANRPAIEKATEQFEEQLKTAATETTGNLDVGAPASIPTPPEVEATDSMPVNVSDIPIIVGEVDSETDTSSTETQSTLPKTETRVRKSSWNAPATAVDKLSSFIQQLSSNIFNRSNSSESDKRSSESSDSLNNFSDVLTKQLSPSGDDRCQPTKNLPTTEPNVSQSKTQSLFVAATKQLKEIKDFGKQVLHMAPMQATHQLLPAPLPPPIQNPAAPWEESPSIIVSDRSTDHFVPQESCELSAAHVNIEIKESMCPRLQHHSLNSSICVHSREVADPGGILNFENNTQVRSLHEKKTYSEVAAGTQAHIGQGNDMHDL